jgi:hypothetical protein
MPPPRALPRCNRSGSALFRQRRPGRSMALRGASPSGTAPATSITCSSIRVRSCRVIIVGEPTGSPVSTMQAHSRCGTSRRRRNWLHCSDITALPPKCCATTLRSTQARRRSLHPVRVAASCRAGLAAIAALTTALAGFYRMERPHEMPLFADNGQSVPIRLSMPGPPAPGPTLQAIHLFPSAILFPTWRCSSMGFRR